ncbi:MAG: TIGR04376 family protein [Microcystaceae cyanobacterium]
MGLFEDINNFLETRLDEFLRSNPQLAIQALQEQLQEQEQDTLKVTKALEVEKDRLEKEILELGQEIKTWHFRIEKAKKAGRNDLATAAQEREATLLRQGNQLWGQMEGVKKRLSQGQELLVQIRQRQKEMQAKAAELKTQKTNSTSSSSWDTIGWNQGASYRSPSPQLDPLESEFKKIELNDELERLKRDL